MIQILEPLPSELAKYYHLRWKILRQPLGLKKGTEKIKLNILDNYTSKINKKNSIILIDAQGHEPEIFLGAKKTLKKKVPLIFELMPNLINENQLNIHTFSAPDAPDPVPALRGGSEPLAFTTLASWPLARVGVAPSHSHLQPSPLTPLTPLN